MVPTWVIIAIIIVIVLSLTIFMAWGFNHLLKSNLDERYEQEKKSPFSRFRVDLRFGKDFYKAFLKGAGLYLLVTMIIILLFTIYELFQIR